MKNSPVNLKSAIFCLFGPAISFLSSCATEPSMMFRSEANSVVSEHTTSTISIPKGSIASLELRQARFAVLPESVSGLGRRIGTDRKSRPLILESFGNREIFMYVTVYKNGRQVGNHVVSDMVRNVHRRFPVPITSPRFFTDVMGDGYYELEIKAYEIDSSRFIRAYRRTENLDIAALEATYNFGKAFATGFGDIIKGATSIATAITGSSMDQLIAKFNAKLLFEHSIYVIPGDGSELESGLGPEAGKYQEFYIVSNAGHSFLETPYKNYSKEVVVDQPTPDPLKDTGDTNPSEENTPDVPPVRAVVAESSPAEILQVQDMITHFNANGSRPWYHFVKIRATNITSEAAIEEVEEN